MGYQHLHVDYLKAEGIKIKIKRFKKLFYDYNKNKPLLKTPEKVFHTNIYTWVTNI